MINFFFVFSERIGRKFNFFGPTGQYIEVHPYVHVYIGVLISTIFVKSGKVDWLSL